MRHPGVTLVLALFLCGLGACVSALSAPSQDPGAPLESPTLRVLTYNLHHGEGTDGVLDLERIAALIRESQADLVALQEVDRGVARTGGVDQLEVLAELTGLTPSFAKFMDFQGGEYGLGLLSRCPVEVAWTIPLPPGTQEPRAAAAVRVLAPDIGELVFVSLHLDWLADDERRFAQAEALLAALADESAPVVLAGDVNDVPGSRTLRALTAVFASAAKPADARFTFPSDVPAREIDFVLVHPAETIEANARVLDERVASDHRPVLAELRFSP